jgi:hypothetical protein
MNTDPDPVYTCGDKVNCVDDRFPRAIVDWCDQLPKAGCIYTIRAIQPGSNPITGVRCLGLLLQEIVNPQTPEGRETGFDHNRFSHFDSDYARNETTRPVQIAEISAV